MRHLALFAALCLSATGLPATAAELPRPAPALPQRPIAMLATEIYPDWRMSCQQISLMDKACRLQEDLYDARTHQPMIHMALARIKGAETLVIAMPFNILLEPGLGLYLDGPPTLAPFKVCDRFGCIVQIAFGRDFAAKFEAARAPCMLFANLDGRVFCAPFSLKGFAQSYPAFAAVKSSAPDNDKTSDAATTLAPFGKK